MALNLGFWLIEGVRGFFHHRITAVVTILGMAMSLWIFGFFYLVWENLERYKQKLLSGFQLEVFLDVASDAANHRAIGEQISSLDGIKDVVYISKQEAAKNFALEFGDEIFGILEENPLPASFKVTTSSTKNFNVTARFLARQIEALPGVDEVVFQGSLMEIIEKRFHDFSRTFLIVGGVILLGTMIIFIQGIKLSISSRKNFVNSMLLAGAKFRVIRFPFILEGVLTGVFSGAVAYLGLILIQFLVNKFLLNFDLVPGLYILVIMGTFLGFFAAIISVSRNLRGLVFISKKANY
jgi:cell division transport system permease protein